MDEILAKRLMEILMVTQGSCKLPVHFMILHGYEKLVLLGFSKSHLKHMLVKIGSFPQVSGLKKQKSLKTTPGIYYNILRLNDNQ